MPEKGYLEVGSNGQGEVVINHGDLKPDENGVGHIVFSVAEARNLAKILNRQASIAEKEKASGRVLPMCNHAGVVSQDECPYCAAGTPGWDEQGRKL